VRQEHVGVDVVQRRALGPGDDAQRRLEGPRAEERRGPAEHGAGAEAGDDLFGRGGWAAVFCL
jgi:hypothetical protein